MMNAWREFRQSSYFVGNVNQFTFCFHAEKNDKFLLVQQSLQFFFLFPSINLESESELLFRRKFEELKLSYDKADGVSYYRIIIQRARIWQLDPARREQNSLSLFFRLSIENVFFTH